MFAGSMPNPRTSCSLVDTATKCFATAASSPSVASVQSRAVRALVMVSRVVNVFDAMMKSVVSGSRSRVASRKSAPSTFETNRYVIERSEYGASAVVAMRGPRSLPPIPTLTTASMRRPV